MANEFLSFRQYEWKRSYLAIPNKQLSKRIEELEQQINQIDSKIIRLENQVYGIVAIFESGVVDLNHL